MANNVILDEVFDPVIEKHKGNLIRANSATISEFDCMSELEQLKQQLAEMIKQSKIGQNYAYSDIETLLIGEQKK